jgi:hypothetical protein
MKIDHPVAPRKVAFREKIRANINKGPRPVGKAIVRLTVILDAADRSTRLGDWQIGFCDDLRNRVAQYGERLILSPRQRDCLAKIAERLGVPQL